MSETGSREILTAQELLADPLFAGVPPKFLLWQQGLAVRWWVRPGEAICRQGDPGNTAFLIRRGRLEVRGYAPRPKGVTLRKMLRRAAAPPPQGATAAATLRPRAGGGGEPLFKQQLTPADKIVGEMACLAGTP